MKQYMICCLVLMLSLSACRVSDYELSEQELEVIVGASGTTTWTKENDYLLDGLVFVNPGQTLIIEAGTVIRAKIGQDVNASALVVARGGRIIAKGTKENPIIFTCENDDLEGSVDVYARGLWGGVIILGNAPVNTPKGEASIEGIPLSEERGVYGGSDPADNSGVLEYVSIRHGGTDIGEDNEINGLTLGGVGKGTVINHIEVISNKDDGVEVFGGTVNLKNVAVAFCGDDAFDFDFGYQGKCQFLLGIQSEQVGDRLAEHDGGISLGDGEPFTIPEIYNATFIGSGASHTQTLISFSDNGGGKYANSIFVNQEDGIRIEFFDGISSYQRFDQDDLVFSNNVFYDINANQVDLLAHVMEPSGHELSDKTEAFIAQLVLRQNKIGDTGIGKLAKTYKVLPDSLATNGLLGYSSDWFDWVTYKGAFGLDNWLEDWSLLDMEGLIE